MYKTESVIAFGALNSFWPNYNFKSTKLPMKSDNHMQASEKSCKINFLIQHTSYGKKDPPKWNPTIFTRLAEELYNVMRRQSMNNLRVPVYNVVQSNGENWHQPDDYNWCKHKGYLMSAAMLQSKEANQNDTGKQDKYTYQE